MDARQVRYFLAIVESRGFSAAASDVYVSQPTLTQAMHDLESDLGVRLFERAGRGVILSDDGRRFLPAARGLMADLRELSETVQRIQQLKAGRLVLATYAEFGVTPLAVLVASFKQRHPRVAVTVSKVHDVDSLVSCLTHGAADLAVTHVPVPDRFGLHVVRHLGVRRFVAAVPRNHPCLARGRELRPADLSDLSLVVGPRGTPSRLIADEFVGDVQPEALLEFAQDDRLSHAVAGGLGCAIVSREAAASLAARGEGHALQLAGRPTLKYALVARGGALSSAAQAFAQLCGGGADSPARAFT